jgi:alpha-ketoglutarate-dependent 2,4-dichlorophenoxyacetate dioxygenase
LTFLLDGCVIGETDTAKGGGGTGPPEWHTMLKDTLKTTPLHRDFGVEVHGVRLANVTANEGYPEIRDLFDRHSLLLFRGQDLDDDAQLAFGRLFGPLEDRTERPEPKISNVENLRDDGSVVAEDDETLHLFNLQSNFLWHTDSTFLPVPALANILQAKIVPDGGGNTEFVSTRAGFARLEPALQARLRDTVFRHRYAHSRARINPELAKQTLFTKWPDTAWKAVWPNPVTGEEAAYVASHVFGAVGMSDAEGEALADEVIAAMTQPECIYSHAWTPGDVLIWDERATLHRGTPWDYTQPRKLASICVSAQARDGLDSIRAA